MSSPVVSVVPEAPVSWVTMLLEKRGFSAAPVIDMGGLVGIVSLTDLLRVRDERSTARVKSCMTRDVVTARDDEPLEAAARRLADERVHRLVVTSDGLVSGILSARDVLDALGDVHIQDPIATIMTTDVKTVDVDDPIALATDRLADARVHGLVVLDGTGDGRPVGVFTRTEALAARHLPRDRATTVGDVMSHETLCLDVTTPIERVVRFVRSMNVRRILAVKHRHLAGVLSVIDLVAAAARSDVGDACSP